MSAAPYDTLSPELILSAVEALGYQCDGRLLALNSYENRVYQIGIEDAAPLIAKFYRPHRWSDEAILEEHEFTLALADVEIPSVPPLAYGNGRTLHTYEDFRFALFLRRGGRHPDLESEQDLEWMGRFIARIHGVGATQSYRHRPHLDIQSFGIDAYQYVLENGFVPAELALTYRSVAEDVLSRVQARFDQCGPQRAIRLHGDCHRGNILWTDQGPHFVDFDDSRMGPAIQDLWMLLAGDRDMMTLQLEALLRGYRQFAQFDYSQIGLIEPLRALRLLHYSAWLARRWDDPAFPAAFPWFNTPRYWDEQILTLREQMAALDEVPLQPQF